MLLDHSLRFLNKEREILTSVRTCLKVSSEKFVLKIVHSRHWNIKR